LKMRITALAVLGFALFGLAGCFDCPEWQKFGKGPPGSCKTPTDPLKRPASGIESWFTESVFKDLFPKANLGWGPSECSPYNYKSFIIAARYFPKFGTEHFEKDPLGKALNPVYSADETHKRDLAAFFSHATQETGENNPDLYKRLPKKQADACFYRGAFFNWFEGGPKSPFLKNEGLTPEDGKYCVASARYCDNGADNHWFYPCAKGKSGQYYTGCYFGRGAIQISYNFNYGLFQQWLQKEGITHNGKPVDILGEPNLVMTKTDPPLAVMASLWFYMTPQSPKPAMHDIVIGNWVSPDSSYAAGVFGPTSLVINNECGGEDKTDPGGAGESRRIKAFRWFTWYFRVPMNKGDAKTNSCKHFNNGKRFSFPGKKIFNSWDADWKTSWDPSKPCKCAMATYQGYIPAYDPRIMPHMKEMNEFNKKWCERLYQAGYRKQGCANYKPH